MPSLLDALIVRVTYLAIDSLTYLLTDEVGNNERQRMTDATSAENVR